MRFESRLQIGKNGLTQGVIDSINLGLKTHDQIRISVLKSVERNKKAIVQMADEISNRANYNCNYRIIGFTIILRKRSSKPKNIAK